VWFDKNSQDLLIETPQGERTRDIYGVCLGNATFETEKTPRGAVRCFVTGEFLAIPGTNEGSDLARKIIRAARNPLEFYWWRDKSWPIQRARWALIQKPHGGFSTCRATDNNLEDDGKKG
jgi:hypothetical protein